MTTFRIICVSKKLPLNNTKENTLNDSHSLLLQTSSQESKMRKTTRNSLMMAFRKLKCRFLVLDIQRLVTISVLFAMLDHVAGDARKFQPNSDVSTNIITDPKSVASIDFR